MKKPVKLVVILMSKTNGIYIAAILLILVLAGCGSDDNAIVPTEESNDTLEKSITIKIGNITDMTGPGSNGMELVNLALEDAARYYNENNMIPGVKFEVIHWDGQMDPSRTIPGYEWLLQKGSDFLTTCAPGVTVTLRPRMDAENGMLFTQVGELEAIDPPGYVFCLGSIPQYEAFTLLSWIAENDWDYKKNGPARIGAAAWMEPYAIGFVQAMEDYAKVHPDQFEFAGGYLTNCTFDWSNEVQSLRGCNYVFPPMLVHQFAEEMRNTESSTKLIGGSPHTAFFKQVDDADAWSAVDGMLIIYPGDWWNETGEEIDLMKAVLYQYHPDSAEDIKIRGSSYMAIGSYLKMLEIVADAVQNSGVENFDSQSLYDAAQSYAKSIDGRDAYSYTNTKRFMPNEIGVLEVRAKQKTPVRTDPIWYPILTEP